MAIQKNFIDVSKFARLIKKKIFDQNDYNLIEQIN